MIKVNKAKFIATLKKSLAQSAKLREAKRNVLENGLFIPGRNDIADEFQLITSCKADRTRDMSDDETPANLC